MIGRITTTIVLALCGVFAAACGVRSERAPTPRQVGALSEAPADELPTAASPPPVYAAASPAELEDEPPADALPFAVAADLERQPHPLQTLSDEELVALLKRDPKAIGSASLGKPNSGRLLNGVAMPKDAKWDVVDPSHAYGTEETITYISTAIQRVHAEHVGTGVLKIGHISGPKGGRLSPHRSHQSGRDVDLGFYYRDQEAWYLRGTEKNLDVPRTWSLVKALVLETDVRFILLDHSIQRILKEHALAAGEDPGWVEDVFKGTRGKRAALIRHVPGHATHMHVRFYNPVAQETARRSYQALVSLKLVEPPTHYLNHKVRKGETLIGLAKRYGTTVKAIKRANRLRSNKIIARKSYKIPRKGPAAVAGPVEIPPRRLPKSRGASREPEQGS